MPIQKSLLWLLVMTFNMLSCQRFAQREQTASRAVPTTFSSKVPANPPLGLPFDNRALRLSSQGPGEAMVFKGQEALFDCRDCPGTGVKFVPSGRALKLVVLADESGQIGRVVVNGQPLCTDDLVYCEADLPLTTSASIDVRFEARDASVRPYEVVIDASGAGTGAVISNLNGIGCVPGPQCTLTFYPTLSAKPLLLGVKPALGSNFVAWGGDCETQGAQSCSVSLPPGQSRRAISVQWSTNQSFTLQHIGDGQGIVTGLEALGPVDCQDKQCVSRAIRDGQMVTLTAQAQSGSRFAGWSLPECSGLEPHCSFVMSGERRAEARFERSTGCASELWCFDAPQPDAHFYAVWASDAQHAFIVGSSGAAVHWDGTRAAAVETGTRRSLYALWGTSARDVWAVGAQGTALHWNGSAWREVSLAALTQADLYALYGFAADDLYAAGAGGTLLHYDGESWAKIPEATFPDAAPLAGNAPSGETSRPALMALSGLPATHTLYIAGERGYLATLRQGVLEPLPAHFTERTITALFTSSQTVMIATDDAGSAFRLREGAPQLWEQVSSHPRQAPLRAMWGTRRGEAWIAGASGQLRVIYAPDAPLTGQSFDISPAITLRAISGVNMHTAFAVGDNGAILRFNGQKWLTVQAPLLAMANYQEERYAVGHNGVALYFSGGIWQPLDCPGRDTLRAIYAAAPHEAWFVGDHATVLHWDGALCTKQLSGLGGEAGLGDEVDLRAITGRSPREIYATGARGRLIVYDGQRWQPADLPFTQNFNALWSNGPSNIWLAGEGGVVAQVNLRAGTAKLLPSGTRSSLSAIGQSAAGRLLMVGDQGTLVTCQNEQCSANVLSFEGAAPQAGNLNSLTQVSPSEWWISSDNGYVLRHEPEAGSWRAYQTSPQGLIALTPKPQSPTTITSSSPRPAQQEALWYTTGATSTPQSFKLGTAHN